MKVIDQWRLEPVGDAPVIIGTIDGAPAQTGALLRHYRLLGMEIVEDAAGGIFALGGQDRSDGRPAGLVYSPAVHQARRERALADVRALEAGTLDQTALTEAPPLSQWRLHEREGGIRWLSGIVREHPRLIDEDEICTSLVMFICPERGIARTVGRWYRLLEPAE